MPSPLPLNFRPKIIKEFFSAQCSDLDFGTAVASISQGGQMPPCQSVFLICQSVLRTFDVLQSHLQFSSAQLAQLCKFGGPWP